MDTNKELYNLFVKKMQEVDLTEGLGEGDIRVVEAASAPLFPVSPRKKLLLLLGLLMGAFLGIGSTFLVEYMDRSLKSKDEIEAVTGLPVLSSIHILEDSKKKALDWKNYFTNSAFIKKNELFRVLRANIKFSDLKQKSKAILITSSCPGEGKTTISLRLAINMAAAGERVLLVDGDLRKPMIHNFLGIENKNGFTNLIVEETLDRKLIQPDVLERVDVITCGPVPAQPAELIENSRITSVINELSSEYDRIIMDSPPIATVIDAALLATACDGVLLIVDPKTVDRRILKQAQTQMEQVGVRLIGLVLNKISQDSDGYYSHYYDYYKDDEQAGKKKRSLREKKSGEV